MDEATPKYLRDRGIKLSDKLSEELYESKLLFFSEIMCAVKMLKNDRKKITNNSIRDILWMDEKYKIYSKLLLKITAAVSEMREIGHNNFMIGYSIHTHTKFLMDSYLYILEENGIK